MPILRFTGTLLLALLFLVSSSTLAVSTPPAPGIQPPTLQTPVNGALMDNGCHDKSNGVTWDFDWSDVPGATAYHLRVWRNPNLPVINEMNVPASQFHYDSPQTYIINANTTGWHWMVQARVGRRWGPWSRVGTFRVERLDTDCH
jgi:hypothetical protein